MELAEGVALTTLQFYSWIAWASSSRTYLGFMLSELSPNTLPICLIYGLSDPSPSMRPTCSHGVQATMSHLPLTPSEVFFNIIIIIIVQGIKRHVFHRGYHLQYWKVSCFIHGMWIPILPMREILTWSQVDWKIGK